MDNDEDEDEKLKEKNSIENNARIKIKEYFSKNKSLEKNNFNKFIEYIGLSDIWSTEKEQNFFWENLTQNSKNKNEIDYNTVLSGIDAYFEEEDDDEIKDNNLDNKINLIENDNDNDEECDLLMDIDLQSLHFKSINSNPKENEKGENEKSLEIFINNIKDDKNFLYSIRFINEIFFSEYLEKDNKEKNFINNECNSFIVNKEELINEIMSKYNFINSENNFLDNYFKIISKENNNEKELIIEKSFINYINQSIKNIMNEDKSKDSITKPLNINAIKLSNLSNNINISQNLEKLKEYDSNIIKCISSLKNLENNKNYINLVHEYICKYIFNLKNSIYEELEMKSKEYEEKYLNIYSENKNDVINIELENENNKLKIQNEKLIKQNLELLKKLENKEEIKIMKKSEISEFNLNADNIIKDSKTNVPKIKSKIIIPPLKLKLNDEVRKVSEEGSKINNIFKNKENISINSKKNESRSDSKIQEIKNNSSNDMIMEDLTNSDVELFSINNNITDQFLLDTTRLCNEDEELNKAKENKNINLKSNEEEFNLNKLKKNNIESYTTRKGSDLVSYKNNQEYCEEELYEDLNLYQNNNKKNYIPLTDRYPRKFDNLHENIIDKDSIHKNEPGYYKINKIQTYFGIEVNKAKSSKKLIHTNEDIFYGYVNKEKSDFYDFKYLIKESKIKKLFHINNEKIHKNEFFSDEINAIISNNKKKKLILIITFNSFYFLKDSENFECLLKLSVDSLKSITVSKKHFNLIHLSFKEGTDIIIESYQRIEILRFIQNMIDKGIIINELKIASSNYFFMSKKNGEQEKIHTIKNNLFSLTPNFENAQKTGILLIYKSGFFSSYFKEKLVSLSSIGLAIFDDDCKNPKIIPIIGTTIKFIVAQLNKRIYCLKLKTIKDETFIVGSSQKKEIFDWLKEFAEYKKIYQLKMKEINPSFIGDNPINSQNNNVLF